MCDIFEVMESVIKNVGEKKLYHGDSKIEATKRAIHPLCMLCTQPVVRRLAPRIGCKAEKLDMSSFQLDQTVNRNRNGKPVFYLVFTSCISPEKITCIQIVCLSANHGVWDGATQKLCDVLAEQCLLACIWYFFDIRYAANPKAPFFLVGIFLFFGLFGFGFIGFFALGSFFGLWILWRQLGRHLGRELGWGLRCQLGRGFHGLFAFHFAFLFGDFALLAFLCHDWRPTVAQLQKR